MKREKGAVFLLVQMAIHFLISAGGTQYTCAN